MTKTDLLSLFHLALSSPFGWIVATNDPQRLRQELNAQRAAAGDPDLAAISIRTSPLAPEDELWLVKDAKKRS